MIHKRARGSLVGLLARATVVATAGGAVLFGTPAAATPAQPVVTGPATTVTLVTGDVVTLGGPRGVDVRPASGRAHVAFRSFTDVDGDLHVVPQDAARAVATGRLDPRLFDVSELARHGYADADRPDLPLIVDYPGAVAPRAAAGARTVAALPMLGASVLRADRGPAFWAGARDSASRIWLDGPVRASLEHSVPQIGAPTAWAAGHTGTGTTVAVLDTGIDTTHPDLDDAVTEARDFTGSASGTDDRRGHGTHVASIITGSGDRHRGVAPDTTLLNGKVLNDVGDGYESWIIAGMEWAAASGADVVNMSLGSPWPSTGTGPMEQALNRLTADTGTLFVVSSGNSGPGAGSVGSPAAADAALSVGAVDRDDRLAEFSSRGPRMGDGAIKPDITAPGVGIVAAKAAHGVIGEPAGDGYVALDGTSMAAPHVAGAAALLAGQHPDWAADRLKATLMGTATPNPALSVFEQGAGRVDVAAAVATPVSAGPASLSLGTARWPHGDDEPIRSTMTYANSGNTPLTLDLSTDVRGPAGQAAPAGMFTVSPSRLTVPAGGTARAVLTTDTRVEAADGRYTGVVLASAGDHLVRTPVAVTREVESYDLKLTFLDHNGEPTANYGYQFVDIDHPRSYGDHDESGTAVTRVPKGTYYVSGFIQTPSTERMWPLTEITEPTLVVDGPAEYTFDARDGVAPDITVDQPNARPGSAVNSYRRTTSWGTTGGSWHRSSFHNVWTRPSRTSAPGAFTFTLSAQLAEPDGTELGGFHASPYLYNVEKSVTGAVPARPVFHVSDEELAKVVSTHAVANPGRIGLRDNFLTMPLPHTLTEYYTPGSRWTSSFSEAISVDELSPNGTMTLVQEPRSYQLGRTTEERWNTGVFSPGFASQPEFVGWSFARFGDRLQFNIGPHADRHSDVFGFIQVSTGQTQLLRDGAVVADSSWPGFVEAILPAEPATYTVRTSATHPGRLSTVVDAEWTFRSGRADGADPTPVPALAVRFAPNLDEYNAAPAGRAFRIPVSVQRNGFSAPGRVNTPVIDVSYDDGKTWRSARVLRHRGQWTAQVHHPRDAEFVSLRWSVTDRDGNAGKATILRAYALR